jgi:hypothetical protein
MAGSGRNGDNSSVPAARRHPRAGGPSARAAQAAAGAGKLTQITGDAAQVAVLYGGFAYPEIEDWARHTRDYFSSPAGVLLPDVL